MILSGLWIIEILSFVILRSCWLGLVKILWLLNRILSVFVIKHYGLLEVTLDYRLLNDRLNFLGELSLVRIAPEVRIFFNHFDCVFKHFQAVDFLFPFFHQIFWLLNQGLPFLILIEKLSNLHLHRILEPADIEVTHNLGN